MSQWAEVRHLHLVEGVSKKEIARRLQLDIKTVRRAVGRATPPGRVSSPRASSLDPWREQIEQWLREDRKLTAKRVRRLLLPLAGAVSPRTVRRYVEGGHCQLVEGSALLPREIDAPDRFQQAHVSASHSTNARVRSRRW